MGKKAVRVAASSSEQDAWLESLTAEDRQLAKSVGCKNAVELEMEKKKKAERDKKAKAAQEKQLKENEWKEYHAKEAEKKQREKQREEKKYEQELTAAKQKAKKEGIVEAWEYPDGVWWAELPGGLWKEVQGNYYCTLCEKHLNDSSLDAHLKSENHKKKLWYLDPANAASTAASSSAGPSRPAAAPAAAPLEPQEDWQEKTSDGYLKCIPCGKVIDDSHLGTADHQRRLQRWLESRQMAQEGPKAPSLCYLAMVPWDGGGELCTKCLLCEKWCQDETSHIGTPDAPAGSKDHQKNLRNWSWHKDRVLQERLKYHPAPSVSKAPAAAKAPAAKAGGYATAPTPAPWGPPAPTPAPWGPPAVTPPAAPVPKPPPSRPVVEVDV